MGGNFNITQSFRKHNFWRFRWIRWWRWSLWTDDEIICQSISSLPSDDEEEGDAPEPSYNIIVFQTKDAVHKLQRFTKCSENVENYDLATIFQIEKLVKEQFQKTCLQDMILDFFFLRNSSNVSPLYIFY